MPTLVASVCVACFAVAITAAASPLPAQAAGSRQTPKRIVLIAGEDDDHPPGTHEYSASALLLAQWIEDAAAPGGDGRPGVVAEVHHGGWPDDESVLVRADAIVLISAGADHRRDMHPLLRGDRLAVIERQMVRGCGFGVVHWSVFVPRAEAGDRFLEWMGGHFDYESGPPPQHWASRIQTFAGRVEPVPPPTTGATHPILRGITGFDLTEEWYYRMRLAPGVTPLLQVSPPGELTDGAPARETVAWARERPDGGRGFGFTGGHFLDNWSQPMVRRLLVNAALWLAGAEVPAAGATIATPARRRVLVVTGHDHPAHDWRQVSAAHAEVIARDPRLIVETSEDPESLARPDLERFAAVVLAFNHWDRAPPAEAARTNLLRFVEGGGGLLLPHFSGSNFQPDLPYGVAGAWPAFGQRLAARWWHHAEPASGHDSFGPFRAEITNERHPITWGSDALGAIGTTRGDSRTTQALGAWQTIDELYFKQAGEAPIEPLVVARSRVTGRYEPLAWARGVGRGRVFQTLLGHAPESVRNAGTARLIARAAAWAAGLPVVEIPALPPPSREHESAERRAQASRADGRSGRGFDARLATLSLPAAAAFVARPFVVRCSARLFSKTGYNVLVACEPKSSSTHWEIDSQAGTGFFQAYLPGCEPAEIVSQRDVADGEWHDLRAEFDQGTVRLVVDGDEVARVAVVDRGRNDRRAGTLDIGFTQADGMRIGCDGVLDDVIVTASGATLVALDFEAAPVPVAEPVAERDRPWTPQPVDDDNAPPWQKETDADWNDDRFSAMDTGTFLAASVVVPELGDAAMTPKALAVRLASAAGPAGFLFDTELLRAVAWWRGPFLRHAPARFALLEPPALGARPELMLGRRAGWSRSGDFADPRPHPVGCLPDQRRFVALHRAGDDVILEYALGTTRVFERPGAVVHQGATVFVRDLEVGPTADAWQLLLGETQDAALRSVADEAGVRLDDTGFALVAAPSDAPPGLILRRDGSAARAVIALPPSPVPRRFRVLLGRGDEAARCLRSLAEIERANVGTGPDLAAARRHTPTRFGAPIVARGLLAPADDERTRAYVVDSLEPPFSNPWNALLFTSGLDFLPDGRAAVATAHGDVWIVGGIDATLEHVTWKRFATGLQQPLGLEVVDGTIHVVGRDGITQLIDLDGDDEADTYRAFNRDVEETGSPHLFAMGLARDGAGRLLFIKSGDRQTRHGGALLAASADGSRLEMVATGYRHGNGLGAGGDGWITTADNQGNWVPATRLDAIEAGEFNGYTPAYRGEGAPPGPGRPLCWIPHEVDNSAGGQVFVDRDDFGPLSRQLLHFSYGRAQAMLVLHESVPTPEGPVLQGGVVPLPVEFAAGAMRGRFRPQDGHLYVCGLDGWQTAAVRDGCLQRVRWTGAPLGLPIEMHAEVGRLRLRFAEPLDRATASDPGRYSLARWNYRWTAAYGSPKYSLEDPDRIGEDTLTIDAVEVSSAATEVMLHVDGLAPAMQMRVGFDLRADDGSRVRGSVYPTVHALGSRR